MLGLTIYLFSDGSGDSNGSGYSDGSGDSDFFGDLDGSGDSDASGDSNEGSNPGTTSINGDKKSTATVPNHSYHFWPDLHLEGHV